ncbi:hypothetical protein [Sphaerotilus mobilis]|uniref:Uncharacterized protein n=1 Tax=Sphaerotilus mobilis TaxID=47994 RepID=A0A4Q7LQ00_9BURK|nr:hypothetical protein [Sphaerotilus mobilis]RZS56865.1 hypothetical protein EV685_1420 [Sphaerotilus mobilis]
MSDRALNPACHAAAAAASADAFAVVSHDIGRDFARHGLPLPGGLARSGDPMWCGWLAGQALFGLRPWPADERTRRWLHLRLQASLRGEAFEPCRVTPHLVGRIDASHCPVTRRRLDTAALTEPARTPHPDDARLVTLDRRQGVDAGLLVMLSRRAAAVLDSHDLDDLSDRSVAIEGLDTAQRERLAALLGYVTPMSHPEAAVRPLRVLPPNRLQLAQPVQALQALLSRLLLRSGWTARLQGWQALLPHAAQRDALQRFFLALLARVLEAGHAADPLQRRWAIEDAWRDPEVLRLWTRLALQLDAASCTALIERAIARGLCDTAVLCHPDADTPAPQRPVRLLPPLHPSVRTAARTTARPLARPLARSTPAVGRPPLPRSTGLRLAHPVQLSLPWAA